MDLFVVALVHRYMTQVYAKHGAFICFLDEQTGLSFQPSTAKFYNYHYSNDHSNKDMFNVDDSNNRNKKELPWLQLQAMPLTNVSSSPSSSIAALQMAAAEMPFSFLSKMHSEFLLEMPSFFPSKGALTFPSSAPNAGGGYIRNSCHLLTRTIRQLSRQPGAIDERPAGTIRAIWNTPWQKQVKTISSSWSSHRQTFTESLHLGHALMAGVEDMWTTMASDVGTHNTVHGWNGPHRRHSKRPVTI